MRLIIFDKDGTLVEPASRHKFVRYHADQRLLPGVYERIVELNAAGAMFAIASNQGGVSSGYKSLKDAMAEIQYCVSLLPTQSSVRCYFCPDMEGRTCYAGDWRGFENYSWAIPGANYRKPGPGMLLAAIKESGIPVKDCVMIGDRPEDQGAAAAAGVRFLDATEWRSGSACVVTEEKSPVEESGGEGGEGR